MRIPSGNLGEAEARAARGWQSHVERAWIWIWASEGLRARILRRSSTARVVRVPTLSGLCGISLRGGHIRGARAVRALACMGRTRREDGRVSRLPRQRVPGPVTACGRSSRSALVLGQACVRTQMPASGVVVRPHRARKGRARKEVLCYIAYSSRQSPRTILQPRRPREVYS